MPAEIPVPLLQCTKTRCISPVLEHPRRCLVLLLFQPNFNHALQVDQSHPHDIGEIPRGTM